MSAQNSRQSRLLQRRKRRIRSKISGSSERPRLSVFRSAKHVYAQVIDDSTHATLVSVSSFEKDSKTSGNAEACREIGKLIASRCKEKNISKIVFDRGGYQYHGRIKAIAEGAREGGLDF